MAVKYNKIGVDYQLTRKADKFLAHRLLHYLNPDENGVYLDIGCGTGNYTHVLQKKGLQVIGIDPSSQMLAKAKAKTQKVVWRIGTAEKTELDNESVDGIIASLTIHHWRSLKKGFAELGRVLKRGGRLVIFTSTPLQMKGYWLNHYFPKMLTDSMVQMPSYEKVKTAMENAGLEIGATENYSIKPDLQDHFLYCGKENPEIYFRDDIRNGISSFSSLSHQKEVDQGLRELRNDIASGKISDIMDFYKNNGGDYLFIIGQKKGS